MTTTSLNHLSRKRLIVLSVRSTLRPLKTSPPDSLAHVEWVNSKIEVFTSEVTDDDFEQARDLWKIFLEQGVEDKFVNNLCGHLKKALPEVQKHTVGK